MLQLIPAPLHRQLYRIADRLRRIWWRLRKPRRRSVLVIAFDDRGRVLLVRHSYGPPVWALPGGGLGRNEDPGVAAAREFREELGCELADPVLFEVAEGTINGTPDRSHIFVARIVGQPRPDGREIIDARWFAPDALPADMVGVSRRQLDRFRAA